VGDFKPVHPAHVSLRLNPAREGLDRRKLFRGYGQGLYDREEIDEQEKMARGYPRKDWPSRCHKWVEERADDVVYKAGDRVILCMKSTECTPGMWVLDIMDAFARFFEATSVIK
jgi:hypothetical protein